jgi:hypothetical protein
MTTFDVLQIKKDPGNISEKTELAGRRPLRMRFSELDCGGI